MSELRWYLILIGAAILLWIWYSGRRQSKAAKHDVFHNVGEHHDDVLMKDEAGNLRVDVDETPTKSFEEALAEVNAMGEEARREPALPEAEVEPPAAPEIVEEIADETGQEPVLPDEVEDEIIIDSIRTEEAPRFDADEAAVTAAVEDEAPETEEDDTLQLVMMYVVAPDERPFPGRAVLKAFHVHKLRFGEHQIFHRETPNADGRRTVFSISNMLKPGTLIPDETETSDIHGLGVFMQIPCPIKAVDAFNDMLHTAQHLASSLGGELRDEKLEPLTETTIASIRAQLVAQADD